MSEVVDTIEAEKIVEPLHKMRCVVRVEPQIPFAEVQVENNIVVSGTERWQRQLLRSFERHQSPRQR